VCLGVCLGLGSSVSSYAQPGDVAYPQSLKSEVEELLVLQNQRSSDPRLLTQLAGLYLDMGDDWYREEQDKIVAYQKGAEFAQHSLRLLETQPIAHFYYAANVGQASQLQGLWVSAGAVEEIRTHVTRSLELDSQYAPALYMMGRLLDELPWFWGGDTDRACDFLKKGLASDPTYAHARLNLAKWYIKEQQISLAKRELQKVIQIPPRHRLYSWVHSYKPEATRLLKEIEETPEGHGR